MTKRKREPYVAPRDQSADHALRQEKIGLEKKLAHGKKRLNHALKTAKGLERQKLAKRIAKAKSEGHPGDESARLEREVAALKSLDFQAIAESHLHKTLMKSKDITATQKLPESVVSDVFTRRESKESLESLASINVTARLYNAKLVKTELARVIGVIRQTLGLAFPKDAPRPRIISTDAAGEDVERAETREEGGMANELEWEGFGSTDGTEPTIPHRIGRETVGDRHKTFEDRLASSDDDESDEKRPDTDQRAYDLVADLSLSPEPSISSSPSPAPVKGHEQKNRASAPNSTFLPSLTMGGYWSGSESEPDALDDEGPRKNRRGQRARRQLWEKKFGQRANHLKDAPSQDWDPRRGATGPNDRSSRDRQTSRSGGKLTTTAKYSGWRAREMGNPETNSRPSEKDVQDKPLHPSWEAAKKASAQKRSVTFQGKKVVFD